MRVAPSAYCAARTRALSARSVRDEALMRVMRQVRKENYCVFGARKMHAFLNTHELGVGHVARCTVERLMRRMGIRGVSRRRTRHVSLSAAPCMPPWTWSIGILGPVISTSCGLRTSPECPPRLAGSTSPSSGRVLA